MDNKQSKNKFGTLTAGKDANNDYTSSQGNQSANKQKSKAEYGTLTAKADANDDYS